MSRATGWIVVGLVLLIVGGITLAVGAAEGSAGILTLASLFLLPGLFAVQIGVVALAVRIGTYEIHMALTQPPRESREQVPPPPPPRNREKARGGMLPAGKF